MEELSPSLARRVQWLNRLVDDVVDGHGLSQGWMSGKTPGAVPQRNGCGRYFRFTGVTGDLSLCVNFGLWAASGDTPLWLWISSDVPVSRPNCETGCLRWSRMRVGLMTCRFTWSLGWNTNV